MEWNQFLSSVFRTNMAYLTKLGSVIRHVPDFPYQGIVDSSYITTDQAEFVSEVIDFIKNQKKNRDSLAEELICICILFFFKCLGGFGNRNFYFCSNDWPAITRMNKAINASYSGCACFENIHLFSMIQYMIKETIIGRDDKEEICDAMKNIMGESIVVMIEKEEPFLATEEEMRIGAVINLIFDGRKVAFMGKRK